MNERVTIDRLGPGVSKWATEETQKQILDALTKGGKIGASSSGLKSSSLSDVAKEVKNFEKEQKKATEANKKNTKSTKQNTENKIKLGKALTWMKGGVMGVTGSLIGAMTGQLNLSLELAKSGAVLNSTVSGVSGELGAFGYAAIEANLTISEMTKLTNEYAKVLNVHGIQAFSRMSNVVTRELREFGVTATDGAEMLADYLEMERVMNLRSQLNENQRAQTVSSAMEEMERWRKQLGVSRDEMKKSMLGSLDDDYVASLVSSMESGGDNMSRAFQSITNQLAGDQFTDLRNQLVSAVAQPYGGVATEMYKTIAGFSSDAASTMKELSESVHAGDIENSTRLTAKFLEELADSGASDQARAALNTEFLALSNAARRQRALAEQENEDNRDQAANMARFHDAMKRVRRFIERIGIQVMGSEKMANALDHISTKIEEIVDSGAIERFTHILSNILIRGMDFIANKIGGFLDWFENLSKLENPEEMKHQLMSGISSVLTSAIAGAVSAVDWKVLATTIGGAIVAGFASVRIAGATGKGIGGMIEKMFSGIGKGIGGLLQGLATGLMAFSNPKIALGAGIFALAIALIGAAVAGATWMIGKTLPTFAEGLESFNTINGDNLKSVGLGMVGLAVGLAALTATTMVDNLADMGRNFMNVFRRDNLEGPMGMLRSLAEIDLDGGNFVEMSTAMERLVNAMKEFNELEIKSVTIRGARELLTALSSRHDQVMDPRQAHRNATMVENYNDTARSMDGQSSGNGQQMDMINTGIQEQNEMIGALISNTEEQIRHLKTLIKRIDNR